MRAEFDLIAAHNREDEHFAELSQTIQNQFRGWRSNRINRLAKIVSMMQTFRWYDILASTSLP